MDKKKILIISLGHPDFSKGGAETAAYNLFQGLKNSGEDVTFLARRNEPLHGGSLFSKWKNDQELFFHTNMDNFFLFSNSYLPNIYNEFREFLQVLKPDVIHFHHYIHIGLEVIKEVRNALPDSRIILTLHEYLAICNNNGQMVKPGEKLKLCYHSSPEECSMCFPDKSPADFFMRKQYIMTYFDLVDHFISPSHFLIDRYIDWGLPKEKMSMIENGQPDSKPFPPRELQTEEPLRNRFAFFGQLNPYKGIDVLLGAINKLPRLLKKTIQLDIYGANLELQTPEFIEKIEEALKHIKGNVVFHGSYEPHEMPRLLEQTDWVIIPSVWWENSPMVIQESFNHGRPMIGSDIGGMKEKLEGKGGLLFRNRSSISLSQVIESALNNDVWEEKSREIKITSLSSMIIKEHNKQYYN